MSLFRSFILISFITFSLTACSRGATPASTNLASPTTAADALRATPPPELLATFTPVSTFTPTPSPEPTVTNTRVPTITPTPLPTLTPKSVVTINETLTTAINVRTGPGTDYPVISRLEPGQTTTVIGRNNDSSWWQVSLESGEADSRGWVYGELVTFVGNKEVIPLAEAPSLPPTPIPEAQAGDDGNSGNDDTDTNESVTPEELAQDLQCGKDFCVTYQAMIPMAENGGCIGNHSIYITVLEGLPPGKPMDGVIIGDTYNNVEVPSGSHGPGRTEITLWNNSMTLIAKRNVDGTPYTSEESFNFTAHDELIPAEVLAANGYCGGSVEQCEHDRNHNSVCRGHYSWRVTFHKFN